ncbi:MAG: hypothetical protein ONB24_14380, partial [candidate division KSB1 bacterium]|nr:hypothetical protein [candidate division KSB1 bacterium]
LDFLKGISLMLRAEVQANPSASAQFYAQAIQKLTTVQKAGDAQSLQSYYGEAKYAQCRAKFFAKTWDPLRPQSIDLNEIKYLINQRRSLRTLYLLAEYCRDTGRYPEAVACYNIIKKKAYNDPDGRFWLVNAEAGIARCGSQDENVKLFQELGIQIEDVVFPDILTQVGNRPVMYEFLADTKFLQMQKAEEARKFLIAFGLPKKSLYPSKNILRYSWRVNDNIFETVTSPIDEKLTKIAAGLNVVVIDDSGKPPALISAFVDGIETSIQDGRFEVKDRALNTKANILIRANGYYPRYIEHFFSKPQTDTLIVPLIKEHWFEKNDFITDRKLLQVGDRFAENFIIVQDNKLLSTDSPLYKCIAESLYIRDFVFHRQGFYLFVDAQENRIVRIDNEQQSWENGTTFSLQFPSIIHPDFLKSPEGIAVDRKGNIYIADWGNHRVLMAQPNGIVTRQLGSFGKNVKGVMGEEIKFAYPTRIAVAEDTVGIAYNGKRIYQNALIFVADANGVHMVDETGRYLMTAVSPSRELPFGEFYSIAVEGFGKQAALFLANRKNGKILNFKAQ